MRESPPPGPPGEVLGETTTTLPQYNIANHLSNNPLDDHTGEPTGTSPDEEHRLKSTKSTNKTHLDLFDGGENRLHADRSQHTGKLHTGNLKTMSLGY